MDIYLILEKFTATVPVSLSIYENDVAIKKYNAQSFSNNLAYQMMEPYFNSEHNVCFLVTPEYIECGFIRITEKNQLLIVGPVSPYEPTPRQAEQFLKHLKLPLNKLADILSWFHNLPVMDSKNFREMLDFLNYIINDTTDEPIRLSYHVPIFNSTLQSEELAYIDTFTKNAEDLLLPCIEKGRYEILEANLNVIADIGFLPNLAPNTTRSLKNAFISAAAITSRAAVKGGLDYHTALSLSNYYISKMEKSTLYADIEQLLRSMIMDYARRTAKIQSIQTDSATANAICNYVNANLSEKITAKDIADSLQLSEAYISHHFKEKTGIKLSDYICMQKIKEAQFLLETTELSLSVISERLAFSSQQYFQTVFKKYIKMTPQQYRSSLS